MKKKQMKLKGTPGMLCMCVLMTLFLLPAVSCRKNNSLAVSPVGLQNIASQLEGEILNGSLSTESDEEGLALWCNGGKILIAVAKIPTQQFADPGNIKQVQIVYSNFGLIIRDTDTNKIWYYIQNDAESQKRFESLLFTGENPIISHITESIKINLS
jgi:hypothetical protein